MWSVSVSFKKLTTFLLSLQKVAVATRIISLYLILLVLRAATSTFSISILNKVGLNFDVRKSIVFVWAGIRAPIFIVVGLFQVHRNERNLAVMVTQGLTEI